MVGVDAMHQSCLEWTIFNPFQLSRSLEATFYHGSSTLTQWKVTFQPLERRPSNLAFSVCLESRESSARSCEIVADRLLIRISLNGDCISKREATNYHFNRSNWHRYYISETGTMHSETETRQLVIRIEISLPGRDAECLGNSSFSCDRFLSLLKIDLERLSKDKDYSNMCLVSSNEPERVVRAHSYIMEARWNNFFRWHAFEVGTQNTLKVDITHDLLKDILNYMYTSEFSKKQSGFSQPGYVTELFQVINHYELYHLYKVLVKSDSQQVQVVRNPMLVEHLLFPLDSFDGLPMESKSRTFFIEQGPEYSIVFRTRVRHDAGNLLSYTLRSESSRRVHVQVNMELVKRVGGDDLQRVCSFHEESHTIDPKGFVQSKGIVLGQLTMLGDSVDEAGIKYFLRCVLNITNATVVSQVQSADDTFQTDVMRLSVLSDHMYKLRKRKFDADMVVIGSSEDLRFGEDRIHKGILAARVPEWWAGLENAQQVNGIPDKARFTLDSSTLPFVLDYMYTGKVLSLPYSYINEVLGFATKSAFSSLFYFVLDSPLLDVCLG